MSAAGGGRPRLLARAPRAADRPHRLQGRLAGAVAAVARRAASPASPWTSRRSPRCTSWRASARACRASTATCATTRRSPPRSPTPRPEVVIHMAAQSLVRRSFAEPRETYETNVMGTVNLLDAVRVTAATCASSSTSPPTSATRTASGSGATARTSRWAATTRTRARRAAPSSSPAPSAARSSPTRDGTRLASARAGNVIGGGDWGEDRLVPDLMRAALAGRAVRVRNPNSIRPWQHVLNPLSGYLVLAQALWDSPELARRLELRARRARTRGRSAGSSSASPSCGRGELRWSSTTGPHPHEARYLKLDSSRARARLGWRPLLGLERGARGDRRLVPRSCARGADMRAVTLGADRGASRVRWSRRS